MRFSPPLLGALLSLLLAGCASNGDPRDPLESMNRGIYKFNEGLDRVVMKPVATGYRRVMPGFAQTGVRHVFSNLGDVTILANDILQLKLQQSSSDLLRLSFNSLFGFAGLLDIASEMGLRKHDEDFGQTLGRWGIGDGPYLVLPFLGPSNIRDTAGIVVDNSYFDPVLQIDDIATRNQAWVVRTVSSRAELLDTKKALDDAALDPYEFSRDFYLERRRSQVYDGKPPAEE
jgi:phospholipid-binding lipoprotein MlaA